MIINEPVGAAAVSSAPIETTKSVEVIKPPTATENPPKVSVSRHQDFEKPREQSHSFEEEEHLTLEAAIFSAHSFSDAEIASVIEAQGAANAEQSATADKQAIAEASRIKEAFQAGVSTTSLLEIIRGADLNTISILLGEAKQTVGSHQGTMLPV